MLIGDVEGKFVGPISTRAKEAMNPDVLRALTPLHEKYVSLRQASEWGMRALQGSFSRMKSRLTSNSLKRKQILNAIVLLHNFRTQKVGLNQISEVFNPIYEQYINLDGYDRIARYFQ
jgi:hypothetical protein